MKKRAIAILVLFMSSAATTGEVLAQTCDSLLGGTDCNAGSRKQPPPSYGSPANSDWRLGSSSTMQGLGADLSSGGDQPGFFGAITFGGGGVTCSGPFRSRRC